MLTKEELPECPVATTVQLIGSKWMLLIIRNLQMRPWRFNELKKDLEGISQRFSRTVCAPWRRMASSSAPCTRKYRRGWSTVSLSWDTP